MHRITRRGILAAAAGASLGPAGRRAAAQQELPSHERELLEAARHEGEVAWYCGQYDAETAEAVGRAFAERYPGVRCNVVRSPSEVAFRQLSEDLPADAKRCDVFSSSNPAHCAQLKREGRLLRYRTRNAEGLLPSIRRADPDDHFHITFLGLFLIAYDTRKVSEEEAPRSWTDVLDPKWRGQLAVGHPGFSGATGVWAVQMRQMYTWDYFDRLARNRPRVGRSSQDPVALLNAGECSISVCVPLGTAMYSIARGSPLRAIYPTDGVLAIFAPSAILRDAPHPDAARLFMEYLTSKAMSEVIQRFHNEPLRADVPRAEGARPLDQLALLAPSVEELEKGLPEVREAWRDTFGD